MKKSQVDVSQQAAARKRLREVLRKVLLPRARAGQAELVLAGAPVERHPRPAMVRHVPGPDLPDYEDTGNSTFISHWHDRKLHTSHYPYLGIVVAGEAELEIGTTHALRDEQTYLQSGEYIYLLKTGTTLLFPPGIPYPDGGNAHWFRDSPQPASSIFWYRPLPSGGIVHMCHSGDGQHNIDPSLHVHDPLAQALVFHVIQELSAPVRNQEIVASMWLTFLLRLDRGLHANDLAFFDSELGNAMASSQSPAGGASLPTSQSLQRAVEYIDSRIYAKLTLAEIARQALLSPSHLSALCRRELGCSVMQFVRDRRLLMARNLLAKSDLTVGQIGRTCGFPSASYFNVVFHRAMGQPPGDYRAALQAAEATNQKPAAGAAPPPAAAPALPHSTRVS